MAKHILYTIGIAALILISTAFISCSTSKKGLFGKKSAHEKYADGLESAGLQTTSMGKQWFAAADKSLAQPLTINLPFREAGYFAAEKPSAAGYRFSARTGEKILIRITTKPVSGALLFTELWQEGVENDKHKLLEVVDTLTDQMQYEVERQTNFLVRVQPELLKGIEYTLTITTAPSLAFPVQSSGNPRVISRWGVDRDGGARRHEGIDIAATFRTPAIASADGRVTRVNENNLGGKVIFMSPKGKSYSLYYAHLDSQIVSAGQIVKRGDVLGLVGNTGNARTTAPHLHFGIYTADGAVDPYPFVNQDKIEIPAIVAPLSELNKVVSNQPATTLYTELSEKSNGDKLEPGTVLNILSATGHWYKVRLPDEREGFINSNAVAKSTTRDQILKQSMKLLDQPNADAAAKTTIPAGKTVDVIGHFTGFSLVKHEDKTGWIER